ncbi:MAG: hypothetical protein KAH57_02975, partial [Thermoplasmata archaeon]|nr:hypothetical protein [Thermoplasmata archaeon]
IELLPGAYFFYYFTLEARVEVPGGEQWVYAAIDVFESPGHPEGIAIENGDDTSGLDNFALGNIQVLPKIMLVDDDDANPGSSGDMTSSVLESLVGSGVSVDKIFITQEIEDNTTTRDAPAFSYEQSEIAAPSMEDYDIVIWVTGFVEDPLTNKPRATEGAPGGNIQELMDYMDSRRYLMIVGSSPLEGLNDNFNFGNTQISSGTTTLDEFNDASAFVYKYLGTSLIQPDVDLPTSVPFILIGTDTGEGNLTPLPDAGGDYELDILQQDPVNHLCQLYTPRDAFINETEGVDFEISQGMLTLDSELNPVVTNKVNVLRSWSTPVGEFGSQYRACVMGFDITEIHYLNEKINLFASVLKWFDWEINVGRDLAVTKMELSIITEVVDGLTTTWENVPLGPDNLPKYLDTIEIEVTVRNNGPISESTAVMFYATGPDNIELPITTGIPDPRTGTSEPYTNPTDITGIPSQGGEDLIYKLWLAIGVGIYTFRVVVDPYHLISEISEENNDISYSTSTITSFVTQNNILIVDDDMTEDNFASDLDTQAQRGDLLIDYSGSGGEPSEVFDSSLEVLEYDFETYTVENTYDPGDGTWGLDAGLGILDLKRYNSIIWVTGDSGEDMAGQLETVTIKDMQALIKYLDGDYPEADYLPFDHSENVLFVGKGMIIDLLDQKNEMVIGTSLLTVGDMMDQYLGLDQTGTSISGTQQGIIGPTTGNFIDDIYVGIEYGASDFDSTFDYNTLPVPTTLIGQNERSMIGLYSDNGAGANELVSIQFEKTDLGNETYYRTLIHSWQIRCATHGELETSLNEMIFLALHWFDTPEVKPELLSRNSKIEFDNDNPVLGNSYLVTVEIANLGGVAGGGTVRFMDGNTLIKSESIFINPDQTITLEAIWTPLYAGLREMSIWIDKYDNYD